MKYSAIALMLLLIRPACPAWSLDAPEVIDEKTIRRAELAAEETNYCDALRMYIKVLRLAPDQELRDRARTRLEACGLSPAEILQLDPATLSNDRLEGYSWRIQLNAKLRKKREQDSTLARECLRLAVPFQLDAEGRLKLEVDAKEMAKGVRLLIVLALDEQGPEYAREAQRKLEEIGAVGEKFDALRTALEIPDPAAPKTKEIKDDKTPPKAPAQVELSSELQREIIAGMCLEQLTRLRGLLTQENATRNWEEESRVLERRKLGVAIFKYLLENSAGSNAFKRSTHLVQYWKNIMEARAIENKDNF